MRPSVRPSRIIATWICTCFALGGFAGSSAASGSMGVPHPPGAIDSRGWELVSRDKNRIPVDVGPLLSVDGSKVLYQLLGALPNSGSGSRAMVLAERTGSGWESRSLLPSRAAMLHESYLVTITTADFGAIAATALAGFGPNSPDQGLVRLDDFGNQTVLHIFPTVTGGSGLEAVASDDLAHIFSAVYEPIDASHVPGTKNIYDFGSEAPELVDQMPGSSSAPACGVVSAGGGLGGFAGLSSFVAQHWVSVDGRYVFFESRGNDCVGPAQLYRRDQELGSTTLVSNPATGSTLNNGVAEFLKASPDGATVIYKTATSLVPSDDLDGQASDMDIYRWDESSGNECLTCVVPNAEVEAPKLWNYNVAVSADLSHIYFMSTRAFAGAPSVGDGTNDNLYVWHDGAVEYVAPANGVAAQPFDGTEVTPDGKVLVFPASNPALDAVTGRSNGGYFQFYRFDDQTKDVSCISCPAVGVPTADVPLFLTSGTQAVQAATRAVSDDGSRVFFVSADPLVPQDVNGGKDLYEWKAGQVGLVSSGTAQYASAGAGPLLATISPDGRDVLFSDTAVLTRDAEGDHARKIYDARIGGGFPAQEDDMPPCLGSACRSDRGGGPDLVVPASSIVRGVHSNMVRQRATIRVKRPTAVQRARFARSGELRLAIRAEADGVVKVRARARIAGRLRTVGRSGGRLAARHWSTLTLHLATEARGQLARTGKLTLIVTCRFGRGDVRRDVAITLTRSTARKT